jgi:alkanesulfonate monooxygenase SsuD/methylene tetrahydromethanopterin reductase-like flavin-dependent oxidoreductase (luciferase family)
VTKNIKIGCGFNIVPMWHPLRLAEDYAMADFMTGGRVIFGVGRGYHTRQVETFGSSLLDQNANREMFEEGVEVLFKAFEGKPFSHKGKYYMIPPEVPYRGYISGVIGGDSAEGGAVERHIYRSAGFLNRYGGLGENI